MSLWVLDQAKKYAASVGLPTGGTAAQVLSKIDGTNYNAEWVDASGGGIDQGFKNTIINGDFRINQRVHTSGGTLAEGAYGHDRWKAGTGGCNYTFATVEGKTTITIPATKELLQIIEGENLQSGNYTLSWEGSAQGKIGAGSYADSPITASVTGGTNLTITFGAGTVANVQFEQGSVATLFEQRPLGLERDLCLRYYNRIEGTGGIGDPFAVGICINTTIATGIYFFPTTMRIPPTWGYEGVAGDYRVVSSSAHQCTAVPAHSGSTVNMSRWNHFFTSATLTSGEAALLVAHTSDAAITFDAEL